MNIENNSLIKQTDYTELRLPKFKVNVALKQWWLGFFLLAIFQSLGRSPLMFTVVYYEMVLLVFLLLFIIFYIIDKLSSGKKFNAFERISLGFAFLMPVYSAIVSFIFWKQPLLYGLGTDRSWLFIIAGIFIFYQLKTRNISLHMIRDVMLNLAWIQLTIYLLADILFNPNHFKEAVFVTCNTAKGGCTFTFDIAFLAFAFLFYLFIFFKTNSWKYLLFSIIFFSYIFLIFQKRALTLSLLGTAGLYFFLNLSSKKQFFYFISLTSTLAMAFILIYLIRPDIIFRLNEMYTNVFEVIQGEKVGESSADARIKQIIISGLFWIRKPITIIFGNGNWSNHWAGNPQTYYGRFFPSDIGIVGSVFLYGIIGVTAIQLVFIKLITWIRKIKTNRNDVFFQACKYYMLFYWIRSIPTGGTYFPPGPGVTFTLIALIYFYYYIENQPEKNYELG